MRPAIFFAIPCGGFYDKQSEIIDEVCTAADVKPNIVEDDNQAHLLWPKIMDGIEQADFFVADISFLRPNIMLELGYALKAQPDGHSTFFISDNVDVPADLQGLTYHPYAGLRGFRRKLIDWIVKVVQVDANRFEPNQQDKGFEDYFADRDRFMRWWNPPPGCQFSLTHEGLRFTGAYYPILSTTLGILSDYELTFRAKVEREAIGWVVKGTMDYRINSPIFGIMFSISEKGIFRTHILCEITHDRKLDYYFDSQRDLDTQVDLRARPFVATTRCVRDKVSVDIDSTWNHTFDFGTDPDFAKYYKSVDHKHGQVGFRCARWRPETGEWGEVATVNWVKVREIESG